MGVDMRDGLRDPVGRVSFEFEVELLIERCDDRLKLVVIGKELPKLSVLLEVAPIEMLAHDPCHITRTSIWATATPFPLANDGESR